jgi:hypothetical protein
MPKGKKLPYSKNFEEFLDWVSTEEACLNYLESIRWPDGFRCPSFCYAIYHRSPSRRGAGTQRSPAVFRDLFGQAVHAACDAGLHYFASKMESISKLIPSQASVGLSCSYCIFIHYFNPRAPAPLRETYTYAYSFFILLRHLRQTSVTRRKDRWKLIAIAVQLF